MNNGTTANELRRLEEQYWQALKDRDIKAIVDFTHEPCVVTGAQGVGSFTKKQMQEMMEKPATWVLQDFTMKDVQVHLLDADTGIVAYNVHEELMVDGRSVEFDAGDTSVWVRRDGKWSCALHTESLRGDPFGRDRENS